MQEKDLCIEKLRRKKTFASRNWKEKITFALKGSVSFLRSALAFFLAESRDSRISGRSPLRLELLTKRFPEGVLTYWSGVSWKRSTAPGWNE